MTERLEEGRCHAELMCLVCARQFRPAFFGIFGKNGRVCAVCSGEAVGLVALRSPWGTLKVCVERPG